MRTGHREILGIQVTTSEDGVARRRRVARQIDRVVDALTEKLPSVADHLDTAHADVLAFTAFPKEV